MNHAPWCTFQHEGPCPSENEAMAMRRGEIPMPPVKMRVRCGECGRWYEPLPWDELIGLYRVIVRARTGQRIVRR